MITNGHSKIKGYITISNIGNSIFFLILETWWDVTLASPPLIKYIQVLLPPNFLGHKIEHEIAIDPFLQINFHFRKPCNKRSLGSTL